MCLTEDRTKSACENCRGPHGKTEKHDDGHSSQCLKKKKHIMALWYYGIMADPTAILTSDERSRFNRPKSHN